MVLASPGEVAEAGREGRRAYDVRVERLYHELKRYFVWKTNLVVFEDVQFSSTTYQAQLWASLRAAMWLAFSELPVEILPVQVGTLKKYATGCGSADKRAMLESAVRKNLNCQKLDDNAIDAFHLWCYAYHTTK